MMHDPVSFRQEPNNAFRVNESGNGMNFDLRQNEYDAMNSRRSERRVAAEKENSQVADFYKILHPASQPSKK